MSEWSYLAMMMDDRELLHVKFERGDVFAVCDILDETPEVVNAQDDQGFTLMNKAAFLGMTQWIRVLHCYGANVNTPNKALCTPLHSASSQGHLDAIEALLASNPWNPTTVDLNRGDANRMTAADHAAAGGHLECIELLKGAGAAPPVSAGDLAQLMSAARCRPLHVSERIVPISCDNKYDRRALLAVCNDKVEDIIKARIANIHLAAREGCVDTIYTLGKGREPHYLINALNDRGMTPMAEAARMGHLHIIHVLSGLGADINRRGTEIGTTPICAAVQEGHRNCVVALRNLGADVNLGREDRVSPAFVAAHTARADMIDLLHYLRADLNLPNNDGATPAFIAAQGGHIDVIARLIAYGADLTRRRTTDGASPAFQAARFGHSDLLMMLLDTDDEFKPTNAGDTLVMAAVFANSCACLQKLKSMGFSMVTAPNKAKLTPMVVAARFGYTECLKELLDPIDPDCTEENPRPGPPGMPPIDPRAVHTAARMGHAACVRILAEKGASVNTVNRDGLTPVHVAAQGGSAGCLKVLFAFGATVNAETRDGETPIFQAAICGRTQALEVITMQSGVNINVQRNDGATALYVAAQNRHVQCVDQLLQCKTDRTIPTLMD